MKRAGALQQVSDLSDFGDGRHLRELLSQRGPGEAPSRPHASPDGRHLLLLRRGRPPPQPQLLAFQRVGAGGGGLERRWQPPQPVAGLLFLQSPEAPGSWVLAVVWEQGGSEVWRFGPAAGWQLQQTLELCHGARARIVSIGSQGGSLVWCEERPPSDAQLAPGRSAFRYCICTRALEVGEQGVQLGARRIAVHNSPHYQVLASPQHVFLVPTHATCASVATFLLIWCPREAKVTLVAPSAGFVHSEALHSSDFKKLVFGSVGLLLSTGPLDIHTCALSSCGGLLLLSTRGTVQLVQPDGTWRHVWDLGGSPLVQGDPVQLKAFGSTLACVLAGVLYLIDLTSGRLMEKKILSTKEVHFLESPSGEEEEVRLLMPTGIYRFGVSSPEEGGRPEPPLVGMVFEEACKYYQRRSLRGSQLTVERLKQGGMFQAPIALSAILQHSLHDQEKAAGGLQGTYAKLRSTVSLDLQSYLSLERLKSCVVSAADSDVDQCCEELVGQELSRLLHLDLDRENLAYMNAVFRSFPRAAWKAIRGQLQLQQNGDGLLVARATPDIWKKVLGRPVPPSPQQAEVGPNGVVPLFELICGSLHRFKPKWLPRFVELTQQYVGAPWPYGAKEGPEGGVPLYKRALAVLAGRSERAAPAGELEIEVLLCSGRPKAILQAVQLLIGLGRWQRVVEAAEKFSSLSPLLNKEIFTTLLAEFARHRELDPYVGTLWELCPADLTVPDILSIVLQHFPGAQGDPAPFSDGGAPLTLGLLKPLLCRVAQQPCSQDELYGNFLQGPTFPPPAPPREPRAVPKAAPETAQPAGVHRTPFPGCDSGDAV